MQTKTYDTSNSKYEKFEYQIGKNNLGRHSFVE